MHKWLVISANLCSFRQGGQKSEIIYCILEGYGRLYDEIEERVVFLRKATRK